MAESAPRRLLAVGLLSLAAALGAGACTGDSCFVAGTRVLTPSGLVPIERLAVGDEVIAWDARAGAPVVRRVAACLRAEATDTFRIEAGELVLAGVTGEHPFWDVSRSEWVKARDVRVGMRVLGFLGSGGARVLEVRVAEALPALARPVTVFNLSVGGEEQSYFAEGILVHNKTPADYDEDSDGDGTIDKLDCAIQDPLAYPGAIESCGNGEDDDCDGAVDLEDQDCGGTKGTHRDCDGIEPDPGCSA